MNGRVCGTESGQGRGTDEAESATGGGFPPTPRKRAFFRTPSYGAHPKQNEPVDKWIWKLDIYLPAPDGDKGDGRKTRIFADRLAIGWKKVRYWHLVEEPSQFRWSYLLRGWGRLSLTNWNGGSIVGCLENLWWRKVQFSANFDPRAKCGPLPVLNPARGFVLFLHEKFKNLIHLESVWKFSN